MRSEVTVRSRTVSLCLGAICFLILYKFVIFGAETPAFFKSKPNLASHTKISGKVNQKKSILGKTYAKENATLYTLCRNSDLESLVITIMSWEDRFNHKFHYDWVFLNDEEFTEEFQNITSNLVSGNVFYGVVPPDQWEVPTYIDRERMDRSMAELEEKHLLYATNVPYRHMCRYNSGFFYHHPLMEKYKYYWRVDGDTHMSCDVSLDPFKMMRENDLKYAFTLTMYEMMDSIPTLWESTLKFAEAFPEYIHPKNLARFLTSDDGHSYNGCHFWTNFEIADADFWRGEAFEKYFEFLNGLGGYFYERWGDAPVHSIAASLFLPKEQIAHLDFIGYTHSPVTQIPSDFLSRPQLRCGAHPDRNFDWGDNNNCIRSFYIAQGLDHMIPARLQSRLTHWESDLGPKEETG